MSACPIERSSASRTAQVKWWQRERTFSVEMQTFRIERPSKYLVIGVNRCDSLDSAAVAGTVSASGRDQELAPRTLEALFTAWEHSCFDICQAELTITCCVCRCCCRRCWAAWPFCSAVRKPKPRIAPTLIRHMLHRNAKTNTAGKKHS